MDTLTDTQREEDVKTHRSQPWDWSDDMYKPRNAKDYWLTPEARRRGKEAFFPKISERVVLLLDFGHLASTTMR